MEDLSNTVQEFYTAISDRAVKFGPIGPEFASLTFLEQIESFVSVRAHEMLFCTR